MRLVNMVLASHVGLTMVVNYVKNKKVRRIAYLRASICNYYTEANRLKGNTGENLLV